MIEYQSGEVTLEFNKTENTLNVINNLDVSELYGVSRLVSGANFYEIREEGDLQILYINKARQGYITFNNRTLVIDDGIATDGFVAEFEQLIQIW